MLPHGTWLKLAVKVEEQIVLGQGSDYLILLSRSLTLG